MSFLCKLVKRSKRGCTGLEKTVFLGGSKWGFPLGTARMLQKGSFCIKVHIGGYKKGSKNDQKHVKNINFRPPILGDFGLPVAGWGRKMTNF